MQVAGLELLFRLTAAAAVVVTPTLLFLGLVRLLKRMRDDDLVYQLLTEEQLRDVEKSHSLAGFVDEVTGAPAGATRCPACGTINAAGMETCYDCDAHLH